jgi:hypothetical protein
LKFSYICFWSARFHIKKSQVYCMPFITHIDRKLRERTSFYKSSFFPLKLRTLARILKLNASVIWTLPPFFVLWLVLSWQEIGYQHIQKRSSFMWYYLSNWHTILTTEVDNLSMVLKTLYLFTNFSSRVSVETEY